MDLITHRVNYFMHWKWQRIMEVERSASLCLSLFQSLIGVCRDIWCGLQRIGDFPLYHSSLRLLFVLRFPSNMRYHFMSERQETHQLYKFRTVAFMWRDISPGNSRNIHSCSPIKQPYFYVSFIACRAYLYQPGNDHFLCQQTAVKCFLHTYRQFYT